MAGTKKAPKRVKASTFHKLDEAAQLTIPGFYVPLYDYHPKPSNPEERLANAKLVFDFLTDFGGKSSS